MAEKLVREFASRTNGTEYVIVRPRLIWGRGTLLSQTLKVEMKE